MEKKHLIRGASIAALAVVTMLFCAGCQRIGMPGKAEEAATQVMDVDEEISALVASSQYKEGSWDDRREMAQKLLHEMQRKGLISSYQFNDEESLFSFEYEDGSLGGIRIVDFGAETN